MAPGPRSNAVAPADQLRAFQRSCVANKRCADCVERGPTYVCLDFQTFVCQTCSGIHREFGHKIKSISLSEWTPAEVENVERGGNERAARKWLAKWTSAEVPEPDNLDLEKVRDFLRNKYVEKRWFKEPKQVQEAPAAVAAAAAPHDKAPAALQSVQQKVPHAVGDLLSDASMPPLGAVVVPHLAAPSPTPIRKEAVKVPADQALPPSSLKANLDWTADFNCMPATKVAGFPATGGGLVDLMDFGCTAGEPAKGGNPACDVIADATFLAGSPKAPPLTELQDVDVAPSLQSPVAEPAEEPASAADVPPPPICAAQATAEGELASIGDQMREAVLRGSTDELLRLFKQCSQKPVRRRPVVAEERLRAFSAFDELVASEQAGEGEGEAPPAAGEAAAPQQGTAASPGEASPERSADAPDLPASSEPEPAQPTSSRTDTDEQSVGAQMFFIGDEEETPTQDAAGLAFAGLDGLMPSASAPVKADIQGHVASQLSNALTPQQLEQMDPQELLQMQMMIARALQARSQAATAAAPPPPRPQAAAPGSRAGAGPSVQVGGPGATVEPTSNFGDLLAAFHERNPIAGLT